MSRAGRIQLRQTFWPRVRPTIDVMPCRSAIRRPRGSPNDRPSTRTRPIAPVCHSMRPPKVTFFLQRSVTYRGEEEGQKPTRRAREGDDLGTLSGTSGWCRDRADHLRRGNNRADRTRGPRSPGETQWWEEGAKSDRNPGLSCGRMKAAATHRGRLDRSARQSWMVREVARPMSESPSSPDSFQGAHCPGPGGRRASGGRTGPARRAGDPTRRAGPAGRHAAEPPARFDGHLPVGHGELLRPRRASGSSSWTRPISCSVSWRR